MSCAQPHPRGLDTPSQVEAHIATLWHEYLVDTLGISAPEAQARIQAEIEGTLHVGLLDALESNGWVFRGATVLDVGCGTGALASLLADRGARILGVEPSGEWATAAHQRLRTRDVTDGQITIADGARIPLADCSVDYVMSLQVLEHVHLAVAEQIIHQVARVLRPGGRVYLRSENYCSFWEPHYRVRWLPYLPKWIGARYLRLLGRNPSFLQERIYYNPALAVARTCLDAGLSRSHWSLLIAKFEDPGLVMGFPQRLVARLLCALPARVRNAIAILLSERFQLFNPTFRLELTNE